MRRCGVRLLARISVLKEAKTRMVTEEQTLPLLLSMASIADHRVKRTTANIIAELAEAGLDEGLLPLFLPHSRLYGEYP